jgi:hypothetical protein
MADESTARLTEISDRLDATAQRLRADGVGSEEAARLAAECAEIASQAVAELERLAGSSAQEAAPGQEELL